MSTAATPVIPRSAMLYDIDWNTYKKLGRILQSRRRYRLTYDRGALEIMSPSWEHERPAYLLGRFIDVLTEELQLPVLAGRSVTLRRRRLQRGVEPDNCYWIGNAPRLQGRTRLDLRTDPPPDLAIEVEVTSSAIPRMPIYAALGVPEVWRLSAQGLAFHLLDRGSYRVVPHSNSFPALSSADLAMFLAQIGQGDDNTSVRQFRDWVRRHLLGGPGSTAAPTP